MIHVVATVLIKTGHLQEALAIYSPFSIQVQAEPGCLMYEPTLDLDLGLPTQILHPNRIIVVERWQSVAAFQAHLQTPHVVAYRSAIKDILESISITVSHASEHGKQA